jgi:hypothetical protein
MLRNVKPGSANRRLVAAVPTVLIVLAALALSLAGCSGAISGPAAASALPQAQPVFQVTGFGVNPQEAGPGEEVQVVASITNTGNGSGAYSAELKINGVTDQTREVNLPPGTTQDLKFRVSREAAQVYQVNLGTMSGRFVVKAQLQNALPATASASGSSSCCSTPGTGVSAPSSGSSCCGASGAVAQATPGAPSTSQPVQAPRAPTVRASCCQ